MTKATDQDKALIGMAVNMAAQQFDDLKQSVRGGHTFSADQLATVFEKAEKLMDCLTEYFMAEVGVK